MLELFWQEIGGPPAKKPTRKGFGSELIERETKSVLRGNAMIDYAPDGLCATLILPADPALITLKQE
jgi:two-component sensor histidine kinase